MLFYFFFYYQNYQNGLIDCSFSGKYFLQFRTRKGNTKNGKRNGQGSARGIFQPYDDKFGLSEKGGKFSISNCVLTNHSLRGVAGLLPAESVVFSQLGQVGSVPVVQGLRIFTSRPTNGRHFIGVLPPSRVTDFF